MATLEDTTRRLLAIDESHTIYAVRPWAPSSPAITAPEPVDGSVPTEAAHQGCEYFLEVAIASEFLADWRASLGREPSVLETCSRLIQYAENDA
jgi:hypothetical protein